MSDLTVIERLLTAPQYSLGSVEKSALLLEELRGLTTLHRGVCQPYRRILDATGSGEAQTIGTLKDIPFLPVRLFKTLKLQSVLDNEVLKVLTSSGTTSQQVSRIAVDRETSMLQTKALASIVTSFIGPKRLPMIIIDSAAILRDRTSLSARGAGLVGLSNFGRDHFYALDAEMRLDIDGLKGFLERHGQEPILIFGFTFMVWQYFCGELRRLGAKLPFDRAILIHSGGWKKLQDQNISNHKFKGELQELCGIRRVHNFYGMVEQVGGVYMECEQGCFHAPNVAEIFIRDYRDWSVLAAGQPGLIQTLSVLPRSYPGQSLLTEDIGTVHGIDDCPCGRKGVRFTVQGRIPQAELRGCSDTHAFDKTSTIALSGPNVRQYFPESVNSISIETICTDPFLQQPVSSSFDAITVNFLAAVSESLFKTAGVKKHPELVALAFWLRKANTRLIIQNFQETVGSGQLVMPRGTAFHIAPSNVDTIFVYSWALSMLAGNRNVVRISQNATPQLIMLLDALRRTVAEPQWQAIAQRNLVVTYPHDERISRFLSERANVRVVWGGDATIQSIRSLPSKPVSKDILFGDKVSYCLVNAERYLALDEEQANQTAQRFFDDAYQFGQMACSSPQTVYFGGTAEQCDSASKRFWKLLGNEIVRRKYHDHPALAVEKLVFVDELAANGISVSMPPKAVALPLDVVRIPLSDAGQCSKGCGGGMFFECFINAISELAAIVQTHDQTLICIGYAQDEKAEIARLLCPVGIDRIVEPGQALMFGPVWDGYVLLNELTRRVTVG